MPSSIIIALLCVRAPQSDPFCRSVSKSRSNVIPIIIHVDRCSPNASASGTVLWVVGGESRGVDHSDGVSGIGSLVRLPLKVALPGAERIYRWMDVTFCR